MWRAIASRNLAANSAARITTLSCAVRVRCSNVLTVQGKIKGERGLILVIRLYRRTVPHEGSTHRGASRICLKKLISQSVTGSENKHHNFFTIYCHNISGAKSKIPKINELLTNSLFNVIAFQETWFDDSVVDHDVIRNTNYIIFRQDRGDTSK